MRWKTRPSRRPNLVGDTSRTPRSSTSQLTVLLSSRFAEKVFSFLSQDEVEKLKQEEERKIATLGRRRIQERAYEQDDEYGSGDEEQEIRERYTKADENDNDMR